MASGDEHIEVPIGTIDGINVTFNTSLQYQPNTLFIWLNGLMLSILELEYSETGATSFDISAPPQIGDTLKCRFMEV